MNEIESPALVRYAGDIFFLILFLVIFFFFKPGENGSENDIDGEGSEESPNPLEELLHTDQEESDEQQDALDQNDDSADADEDSHHPKN